MWIFSKKQNVWVNLETAIRISKDGNGGYLVTSIDGKNTSIDSTTYENAQKWIDPDWHKTHNEDGTHSFKFEEAIKAIMKATGAKVEKEGED